jgi:hypothetical protein
MTAKDALPWLTMPLLEIVAAATRRSACRKARADESRSQTIPADGLGVLIAGRCMTTPGTRSIRFASHVDD